MSAVILGACAQKAEDPFQEALTKALEEQLGEPAKKISYTFFERIDTTSFEEEFAMRRETFKLKYSQEKTLYDKYTSQRKPKNAKRHKEAAEKTLEIMNKLDSLYDTMGERLSEPASFDYRFSVSLKGEKAEMNLDEAYASITPDLRVVGLNSKKKSLHKTTGASIPGYAEIIKNAPEEEDEKQ